jgi:DNA-binding MarR family transcriptional regulator
MKLIPKDWNELQQYKDRKPLWIKLHRDLLNDFSYSSVQIGTKATLPLLWLLACEYDDGIIDVSIEEISFRIHIDTKTLDKAIKELIECGFFTIVQDCTEPYENVPREETEKRREETEKKTEVATKVAHHLLFNIRSLNPDFKQPSINTWANDIDKAVRLDNRTEEQLINCINWIYSPAGSFWQPNILSGKKLREKFDTMQAQVRAKQPQTINIPDNNIFDVLESM